nr:hypothetical protein [Tanacetum cinerariifolium]
SYYCLKEVNTARLELKLFRYVVAAAHMKPDHEETQSEDKIGLFSLLKKHKECSWIASAFPSSNGRLRSR